MARVIFWDVDTQYDFMHADGKLYVPEAERIITNLQRLTNYAHGHGIRIVASADDHVMGHPEISDSPDWQSTFPRSEEHTSELQSQSNLVCRLLLEKKKTNANQESHSAGLQ